MHELQQSWAMVNLPAKSCRQRVKRKQNVREVKGVLPGVDEVGVGNES